MPLVYSHGTGLQGTSRVKLVFILVKKISKGRKSPQETSTCSITGHIRFTEPYAGERVRRIQVRDPRVYYVEGTPGRLFK